MNKTTFKISKLDCASEEQMIRMQLADLDNIYSLEFDIANRQLIVLHDNIDNSIFQKLEVLNLNTTLISTVLIENYIKHDTSFQEKRLLWQVLSINLFFFILETIFGYLSHSMGLIADGMDMLADSLVYGLSLFAAGGSTNQKKNVAKWAGYFQLALTLFGIIEVFRRFFGQHALPNYQAMIFVSFFALLGNIICLYLLQKSKSKEAHMQTSMIFTSNDIIINFGVIIAGGLVYATNSKLPDLLIGSVVFFLVGKGTYKILQLSK